MVLPIYAYGQPVLKKKCTAIDSDYPGLQELIVNMWETMYHASGVGLAAPQIGRSIRLFIVDTTQVMKEEEKEKGTKLVLINAEMLAEEGDSWSYEEGCLSIPNIRGDVDRKPNITIKYYDQFFNTHEQQFDGINARVIQHEYDHIEGKLFTEKLKPVKRNLIRRKLEQIKKGKAEADYPLRFVK